MRPEWAWEGTVTTSELPERRRRAAGEKLLIRAPGALGKATTMLGARWMPSTTSVPRSDTWCGFLLQRVLGVQLTRVIRTVVTCNETCTGPPLAGAAADGLLPPDLDVGVDGPAAPPGPAARLGAGDRTYAKHRREERAGEEAPSQLHLQ